METVGDNPNDLLDERDRLIDSLSKMADILTQNKQIPAFIVLGDNEWNDSWNPEQSLGYWNKHLRHLNRQFETPFVVKNQPEREENFSFIDKKSGYFKRTLSWKRITKYSCA